MLKRANFLWLLASPIYLIIGTIRHEGSHALAGLLTGLKIEQFDCLPSIINGRLYWGYVHFNAKISWPIIAAPYLIDLLTFIFFFIICRRLRFSRLWIWLNLIIIGLLSPLISSTYNYLGSFDYANDIDYLTSQIPAIVVHLYFITTILLYCLGLVVVLQTSKEARAHLPQP